MTLIVYNEKSGNNGAYHNGNGKSTSKLKKRSKKQKIYATSLHDILELTFMLEHNDGTSISDIMLWLKKANSGLCDKPEIIERQANRILESARDLGLKIEFLNLGEEGDTDLDSISVRNGNAVTCRIPLHSYVLEDAIKAFCSLHYLLTYMDLTGLQVIPMKQARKIIAGCLNGAYDPCNMYENPERIVNCNTLRPGSFGYFVRQLLLKEGRSQNDLARKVGITSSLLSQHLYGKCRPNEGVQKKYADALRIDYKDVQKFFKN